MIIFAHLLNDASGSPRVLKNVIEVALKHQINCKLFLGYGGKERESSGLLGQMTIPKKRYYYRFLSPLLTRLALYSLSQLLLFCSMIMDKDARHARVVYVNTLLPVGAMLFGALFRKRVVVHIHELELKPHAFHNLILLITRKCADRALFVSKAQAETFDLSQFKSWGVIHNGYDPAILEPAGDRESIKQGFEVLMLASLRDFKGVPAFLKLADHLSEEPEFHFTLVANEDPGVVAEFIEKYARSNLSIVGRPNSTGPYYRASDLVVNLSFPDQFIETFGLTLVEAMAFGKPVIAPPIGGPTEIVDDGENGFLISSYELDSIIARIKELQSDQAKYERFARSAKRNAKRFSPEAFATAMLQEISL